MSEVVVFVVFLGVIWAVCHMVWTVFKRKEADHE